MPETALIIFIKNPILGKAKTRVAASVGKHKALEIYKELLLHTKKVVQSVNTQRYLFYTYFIDKADNWNNNEFHKKLQTEGDLGKKMKDAFEYCFTQGAEKVVIIGSDCGDLSKTHIEKAFNLLNHNEIVIGPAEDGGYYLLGMSKKNYFVFENKEWSTSTLLESTISEIKQHNKTFQLLEILNDIDTFEDYKLWKEK